MQKTLVLLLLASLNASASMDFKVPRPRLVKARMCCAFFPSFELKPIPKLLNHIVSSFQEQGVSTIGKYSFLNRGGSEKNGEVYTELAGFIDTAHLRDQIDWTIYFFLQIKNAKQDLRLKLPRSGGKVGVTLKKEAGLLSVDDQAALAAKMAYDGSVWHEILTWFVPSTPVGINENFSSFSPEDLFSNLLGTQIAQEAILMAAKSEESFDLTKFEELVNSKITSRLKLFRAREIICTQDAMRSLRGLWWNPHPSSQNSRVIKRVTDHHGSVTSKTLKGDGVSLATEADSLDNYFEFVIKPKRKISKKVGLAQKTINQRDFSSMIEFIELDMQSVLDSKVLSFY